MNRSRIILALGLVALIGLIFLLDLDQYLTLDYLRSQQQRFQAFASTEPVSAVGGFFMVYLLITALSIPGAAALTLIAGALFGLLQGTVIVSFRKYCGCDTGNASIALSVSRLCGNSLPEDF